MSHHVFVTGGTGYLGCPLLEALHARGHLVRALVRPGAERRLPAGIRFMHGDALDAANIARALGDADTLVHLVGTPRPSPAKAAEFARVDGPSALAALAAAEASDVRHFVYVSVAQPAPVMGAYIAVRMAVETAIQAASESTRLTATILRPWYMLGPGHWWPHALRPLYAIARQLPATREGALRLGLLTRGEMVAALLHAVEHPSWGVTILDVPAIRATAAQAMREPSSPHQGSFS
jgi:nucleoside-diphosphate-sugar epimerase